MRTPAFGWRMPEPPTVPVAPSHTPGDRASTHALVAPPPILELAPARTDYDALPTLRPWPGRPYPLGATIDLEGTNFSLFSENAEQVELCLFSPDDPEREVVRFTITERTDQVWHIYLPGVRAGTLYGYRVYGAWDPAQGRLYNPNKLLLDPYAKAINGPIEWNPAMFGYTLESEADDRYLVMDERDSAPYASKGVVVDPAFEWGGDLLPEIPMHESIIYELHVKGMTMLNERVPESQRGTYAGLAHPDVITYFRELGVTAVELMPVHHFVHDQILQDRGLRNYWGYNSLGFLAPHADYATDETPGAQVAEFKAMVKAYHRAGLEVILDVVYNHTAEGNHYGPTLSMKGIDNEAYYRLVEGDASFYMDYTGTGNTLNMLNPRVLQLVMDSLRYWVTEMHVDGFRFDLASALARGLFEVGKLSTFLDTIHQDPIISQVKLIAEPWDVGPGGYQVGGFPVLWSEWNGKYRDCLRQYWKGEAGRVAELASRITGSSDLYEAGGRQPWSSINFVTAHDGFTLRDLVSYNDKHNHANGEGGRDGESSNESWNCGVEGPTDDEAINALRMRQQRNLLATLLLSQGVPMLSHGDEVSRSQLGNNNVYCQDNELAWFDWDFTDEQRALRDFVRELIALRKDSLVLHRRRFFSGRAVDSARRSDIYWINTLGREMSEEEWGDGQARSLGVVLNGEALSEMDARGNIIRDDIWFLAFNSYWEDLEFRLPGNGAVTRWQLQVCTASGQTATDRTLLAGETFTLPGRAVMAFLRQRIEGAREERRPWLEQMQRHAN